MDILRLPLEDIERINDYLSIKDTVHFAETCGDLYGPLLSTDWWRVRTHKEYGDTGLSTDGDWRSRYRRFHLDSGWYFMEDGDTVRFTAIAYPDDRITKVDNRGVNPVGVSVSGNLYQLLPTERHMYNEYKWHLTRPKIMDVSRTSYSSLIRDVDGKLLLHVDCDFVEIADVSDISIAEMMYDGHANSAIRDIDGKVWIIQSDNTPRRTDTLRKRLTQSCRSVQLDIPHPVHRLRCNGEIMMAVDTVGNIWTINGTHRHRVDFWKRVVDLYIYGSYLYLVDPDMHIWECRMKNGEIIEYKGIAQIDLVTLSANTESIYVIDRDHNLIRIDRRTHEPNVIPDFKANNVVCGPKYTMVQRYGV